MLYLVDNGRQRLYIVMSHGDCAPRIRDIVPAARHRINRFGGFTGSRFMTNIQSPDRMASSDVYVLCAAHRWRSYNSSNAWNSAVIVVSCFPE